jgi:hypothetical protein
MKNNFLLAKASSIQKAIRTMNIGLDIACNSKSTFLKNSSDFFFSLAPYSREVFERFRARFTFCETK